MNIIKNIARTFIYILAGITICSALYITIFIPEAVLSVMLLWQIILMSAISSCGSLVYCSKKELSKQSMKVRIILHYLYTSMVVLGGAFLFGWIKSNVFPEIIVLFLLMTIQYSMIMIFMFRKEEKTADHLNKRLKEYYPEDE